MMADPEELSSSMRRSRTVGDQAADDAAMLDRLGHDFARALAGENHSTIEDILDRVAEPLRGTLLVELLRIELDHERRCGRSPQRGEYLRRFAAFTGQVNTAFDLSLNETPSVGAHEQTIPIGTGEAVGDYLLLEPIGRGGMGVVYKARHVHMDRIVALKMMSPRLVKNAESAARFEHEIRAAARLAHPNIVTAFDAGEHEGTPYLVMEYIEGRDLASLVHENGPLPVATALDDVLQTARALASAHSQGITHRDLKPANLMLDRDGRVKILDLGLARIETEAGTPDPSLTSPGQLLGTVDYMAPEQARSSRNADPRSDIYSLGCCLYFLLTGKPLFAEESVAGKLLAHQSEPPPRLRATRPEVSAEVDSLFQKMVAKRMEDRYPTMTAVGDELERLAKASPSTPAAAPIAKGSFSRGRVAAVGLALTMTIAAVWWYISRPHDALTEPAAANDDASSSSAPVAAAFTTPSRPKDQEAIQAQAEADAKIQAVLKKLQARNPGFNGKLLGGSTTSDGKVTKLTLEADHLTDLLPLRALPDLESLELRKSRSLPQAPFSDLSPLAGMQLKVLRIQASSVVDLSPLHGMPLTTLDLATTPVADLSPLRGAPLRILNASWTPVADLSPLREMPLTHLNIDVTEVVDLSPLRGLSLEKISLSTTGVSDLGPLRGMPLEEVTLDKTRVVDLSPLRGMPLRTLRIAQTGVSDLSPLEGMPLTYLFAEATPIHDLSPLRGMPLKTLCCFRTKVTVLDPLKDCPTLERLELYYTGANAEQIAALKAALPQCQFVERPKRGERQPVEGQRVTTHLEPPFQRWQRATATLPVEEQIQAVVAKLRELNPQYDGEFTFKLRSGQVGHFGISTKHITDVSPVRAFPKLYYLSLDGKDLGRGERAVLYDLSPLEGLPLKQLSLRATSVADLSPLRGMPLTILICSGSQVTDLAPLKELPLTDLSISSTYVTDLSPLEGMQLKSLVSSANAISDISSLAGMPLTDLSLQDTDVLDLSPLKRCAKLKILNVKDTNVSKASVDDLQRALPDCVIKTSAPSTPASE